MLNPMNGKHLVTVNDPYAKFSDTEREAMAHTWHFHLISAECTIANYLNTYVHELEKMMTAQGLMKFNMKRMMNELNSAVNGMKTLVDGHGRAQINVFCRPIFAPLAEEYRGIGGDLTGRLIFSIRGRINNDITRMFYCTKNMLNRTGCPYADVLNHLQMIMFLVNTDIEFSDVVRKRASKLLAMCGKEIEYKMSPYSAKILKSAKQLISSLFDEKKYPLRESDMKDVRILARVIQEKLVAERTRDAMEEDVWTVRGQFSLFVLLRLAMRMQGEGEPVGHKELKHLLFRLGDKASVRAFLKELSETPLPEGDEMIEKLEAFDIPEDENSMMRKFYELCLRDKTMYRSFSSEQERLFRNLRQMVYWSEDSMISEKMLRYLFIMKNGVKKRVEEFLREADADVMRKTLRRLKSIKVAELQHPRGRYYFDFWRGIDEIRQERRMSDKDMMSIMGVGKTKYYGMKRVTSLKYTGGEDVRRLIRDMSNFMKVDAGYYLYLCMTETDNQLISEQPFEYVLARGMIVYLSKTEPGMEMESGEEYIINN